MEEPLELGRRLQPRTIYAKRRSQGLSASAGSLVLAWIAHSHGANGFALTLAAIGVVLTPVLLRQRLKVGPSGLVVVNFLGATRIPWSEISAIGMATRWQSHCLLINCRDGTSVASWVVTDSTGASYSPAEVDEIVDGLRADLAAATGATPTQVAGEVVAPEVEARADRRSFGFVEVVWGLGCLFFVIFGAVVAWNAATRLPATYAFLRSHGVAANATFAGCHVVDIRTEHCNLTLTYVGHTRTWAYGGELPQFEQLRIGAQVPVLIDPNNPTTVYTAHDVAVRSEAGFGVLFIFGVVLAVLGVLGFGILVWLEMQLRQVAARRKSSAPVTA